MIWGYALIWAGQFLQRDPDSLMAKLKFLKHYGLKTTGVALGEIEKLDERKRDQVFGYLAEHDLHLTPGLHARWLDPDRDEQKRRADWALGLLEKYHRPLRATIVITGAGGPHRFAREPGGRTLAQRLDLLAERLAPAARRCHELGLPFGIENHGDYYCSDLVGLCRRVPHLGIFLDTGNTYLIGEQPLPAFEAAAPYTVGTHFKDHHVRPMPEAKPLHFEVGPSVIGEGDVPLVECYRLLVERAPNPDKLCMMIELIIPSYAGNAPFEALEKSIAFVKTLGK